jgi:hypothetical protein
MQGDLEASGIAAEFVETTDETVYVGYQTHENDASNLLTELQLVVEIALEHEPGAEIKGAIFHTDRPIIGRWHVEPDWAEQYRDDELPETALVVNVLQTLVDVSFA